MYATQLANDAEPSWTGESGHNLRTIGQCQVASQPEGL
jgi:hypothetical protein